MTGIMEKRQRQQDAIDKGEPLLTKKGKEKKGQKKRNVLDSIKKKKTGTSIGKAVLDPGGAYRRAAFRSGIAGKRDSQTIGNVMSYTYQGMTLGIAPAAKLVSDEIRNREAQKKEKKKKKKEKKKEKKGKK